MDLFALLQNQAALFLLMLARMSGIFTLSPFLGSINIPPYVRVGTAFAMSLVLFPVVAAGSGIEAPPTVIAYAGSVLIEVFVGWLIGYVAFVTLSAIHLAGKVMDMQVGFSIVNVMDPTSGQQIPLIGSFLYNLGIIIFLVTNGHYMLISSLFESYGAVPIGGMVANSDLVNLVVDFTASIFMTGIKIALPITFSILLTNVGLGILARTLPQLNIFVVGIPLQITVGIFVLTIVMPFYVMFLDVLFNGMYGNIVAAIRAIQ